VIVNVLRRAISDAVAAFMVDSQSACGFSWYRRPRLFVVGVAWIPEVGLRHREPDSREKLKAYRRPRLFVVGVAWIPEVGLRHREPDSREKLKAWVARVRRDF